MLDQAPETQARRAAQIVLHRIGVLEAKPPEVPVPFLTWNLENA